MVDVVMNVDKKEDFQNVHIPVMLNEVNTFLCEKQGEKNHIIFDGTLGGGGYTEHFLNSGATVYACDLDEQAIKRCGTRLNNFKTQLTLAQANFADYIEQFDDNFFDGIVLDLGYSSNQLELEEKGFSYLKKDQLLDLRFDQTSGKPAWKAIVEMKSDTELRDIFYRYSGEQLSAKFARLVMGYISKRDNQKPILVGELTDLLVSAIPAKLAKKTAGILSRIWQSLRIWTNKEFDSLEHFLPTAIQKLKPNGRLAIVSFHSLEDKLVTKFFRDLSRPVEIDQFGNTVTHFHLLTKKAATPSQEEIEQNPRSRSALLRCVEKI